MPMSMPTISTQNNPISMCQAIADLVASIALAEAALSHILNAQGELIQAVLAMECADICQLLEANDSTASVINAAAALEQILKDKLEFAANNLYYPLQQNG